eukprot:gene1375-32741_t
MCSSVRGTAMIVRANNAEDMLGKLQSKVSLDQAAKRINAGIDRGMDEEDLLEMELGAGSSGVESEVALEYKDKIRERLTQRSDEMREQEQAVKEKKMAKMAFGREAYECVRILEEASEELGVDTDLGGESQLWLGFANAHSTLTKSPPIQSAIWLTTATTVLSDRCEDRRRGIGGATPIWEEKPSGGLASQTPTAHRPNPPQYRVLSS